ncbi:MAG: L,D-transpeptidase family protein [Candidatus Accumulibacter phosphatis]|jgi:murein L,D-transpeptidase YcbB/YkuD|nr:L,D-transpeptidase family protein [Candidatus Accumulibacter sp. ACC012]
MRFWNNDLLGGAGAVRRAATASLGRLAAAMLLTGLAGPALAQAVAAPDAFASRPAPVSSPQAPATTLAQRLEQALNEPASVESSGGSSEAAAIRLFYYGRGYRPAWTDNARRGELIAAVEASREHGLAPDDFDIAALRKVAARSDDDAQMIVHRELLFTETLARLVRQLRYGKVDPSALYSTWNFSPPPGVQERAQTLDEVLEAASLQSALAALAPQDAAYRGLQQALSRFTALAAKGGWPSVPDGPTLRPGESDARVPALRARLQAEGWLAEEGKGKAGKAGKADAAGERQGNKLGKASARGDATRYDKALAEAVQRFQTAHGLRPDAAVGSNTVAALNVSAAERVAQIRVNLERVRWVARDMSADRLVVDITSFNAALQLDGARVWSSKVMVGRPARETPVLLDHVQHLVLNPKWVVPPTILREDVIPGMNRNAAYLQQHNLRIVNRSGQAVAPEQIDWSSARRGGFPYQVVQESGSRGALGQVKFSLSNGYAIYLHDTPSRALFSKPVRALSSGCVRIEKPRELALLLLDDPERWNEQALAAAIASARTRTLPVGRHVPVMLLYRTAVAEGSDAADNMGTVSFRVDIYNQDPPLLAMLDRRSRPRP